MSSRKRPTRPTSTRKCIYIKDRRDMENLIDTARRYGEIADQMFDRWSIPGRYLVFGDKADLARLKALELCELDAFYVDCEDDGMTGDAE